ncbi:MAG: hypothetical protein ACREC0_13870 [Methylocella sp.]
MAKKDVPLECPVKWFGKSISTVELREPTAGEYLELGEPVVWARSADGAVFGVEQPSVISAYLAKCVTVENALPFMSLLSLGDGRRIKEPFVGFFQAPPAQTTSSDNSANSAST